VSPDISAVPRFDQAILGDQPVRSLMSIPLMVQDEIVAVLNVHSYRPNAYSEDDVKVLSIIASQGAAIYKELEALSALTSYTDSILSSVAAGVVTLDSDGVVLTWNKAAAAISGVSAEQVVGMLCRQAIDALNIEDADKASTVSTIQKVFDTAEVYQGYKLCFHPLNKDEIYLNMSISPLLNNAGEQLGVVIIFEDITREIKMEQDFQRVGELAAVGQLAASIAHELRNPLSSIKGAAQLLREQYSDHLTIIEFLDIILEEVDSLSKLTTEFLDYARPMQLELRPTDVNDVVRKTLQLMFMQINDSRVALSENLAQDLPTIEIDDKQIEQVLRNIILNALQAMPGGGSLEIATCAHRGHAGGVELTVADTGSGIPPEKLDRIFTPFYTTKTKGTGLGLSVVRRIVENHGGRIDVASEEGKGSTFSIILPRRPAMPLPPIEEDLEVRRESPGPSKELEGDR
jgi:PAS domain S-box-containing protein